MNDKQLEKKIRQDTARVKKDLRTLVEDSATRLRRFEDKVSQSTGKAKEDLTTWVGDGVSHLGEGFEKLTDDAKENVVGAAVTVKKGLGRGLSQYNARAQQVADIVPGGFGNKAAKYPWVAISIALVFGLLLGGLFKPAPQSIG